MGFEVGEATATPDAERRKVVLAGGQIVVSDRFIDEVGAFAFNQWLVGFNKELRRVCVGSRYSFSICVDRMEPGDYNEIVIKAAVNDDFRMFAAG